MRFYQQQHGFYCGVDLHAKTMHVCIVDQAGQTRVHKNIGVKGDILLCLLKQNVPFSLPGAVVWLFVLLNQRRRKGRGTGRE